MTGHQYGPQTQRIISAILSGDCCDHCHTPTGDRHLDECPRHPNNLATSALTPLSPVEPVPTVMTTLERPMR